MKKRMLMMLAFFGFIALISNISIIRTVDPKKPTEAAPVDKNEMAEKAIENIISRIKTLEGFIAKIENNLWGSGPTFTSWTKLQNYKAEYMAIQKTLGVDALLEDLEATMNSSNEAAAPVLAASYDAYKELNAALDNQIFNNPEIQGLQKKLQAAVANLAGAVAKNMTGIKARAIAIFNNKSTTVARNTYAPTLSGEKTSITSIHEQISEKMRSDPKKIDRINELDIAMAQATADLYQHYGKDKSALEKIAEYKNSIQRLKLLLNGIKDIQTIMLLKPDSFFIQ